MTVTDATTRPPLELPATVTVDAAYFDWLYARSAELSEALGMLGAIVDLGLLTESNVERYRRIAAGVQAASDAYLGRSS